MAVTAQLAVPTQVDRLDGRTRHAKRLRGLIDGLARDLGHQPTTAEQALIEQAASLIVQREAMESAMTAGEPVNSQELTKVAGAITRCLATLRGKSGKQRGVPGLTLADHIERKRLEKVASASAGDAA
jgi:hypothetical protein